MERIATTDSHSKTKESRMSFRVSALVAAAVVLELSLATTASAQPVAPVRPRSSIFGNVFTPGLQQQQFQQQLFLNQALGGGGGVVPLFGVPGGMNPNFPGGQLPGQLANQPALPGAFSPVAGGPPRQAAVFNSLSPYYGRSNGNYGHWYPNGIASGRGVLGSSGGGGGGSSPSGGGAGPAGMGTNRFGSSMIGNVGGTALGVGAMMNQFRR
jgi:hypothetical protein